MLLVWLDENSLGLNDVGLEHIRDYIAALDERGYAGSTMARRITVARGLHKFLIAEELGTRDPTSNLSSMRRPRKLPFVLSIAETEALLETAHRIAAIPQSGFTVRPAMPDGRPCSRPSMPRACASARRCRCPPMLRPPAPACC